jgi:hypothetical protein
VIAIRSRIADDRICRVRLAKSPAYRAISWLVV